MDRYQFEDLISDYIENSLSLAKRREFEEFVTQNPEYQSQVDDLRWLIAHMHNMPSVTTSPDFMLKLSARVEQAKHKKRIFAPQAASAPRRILGFTPLYAGLMAAVLIAIVTVGIQLVPSSSGPIPGPAPYVSTNTSQNQELSPLDDNADLSQTEEVTDDSLAAPKQLPETDPYHQEHIKMVGDR